MGCIHQTPYFNQFDRVILKIGSTINRDGVDDVIFNLSNGELNDGMGYPLKPHKIITFKDLRDLYGLFIIKFDIINFNDYLSHKNKHGVLFNDLRRL